MPYSVREALAAFRRTPLLTALSVLAIALSLFVVGLFSLAAFNVRLAIEASRSGWRSSPTCRRASGGAGLQ
jgi:cell division protein FtsX